jgi:uncharacterized protein DUF4158
MPVGVIAYVASQLSIANPQCIVRYAERIQTQQDHAQEIRQHYSYKEFSDRRGGFALMRFLYACCSSLERTGFSMEQAILHALLASVLWY